MQEMIDAGTFPSLEKEKNPLMRISSPADESCRPDH
jgi:hypothetical protein